MLHSKKNFIISSLTLILIISPTIYHQSQLNSTNTRLDELKSTNTNHQENTIEEIALNNGQVRDDVDSIIDEDITEFDSRQIDLDNDGLNEDIVLKQLENNLILTVDNNEITILKEFEYLPLLMEVPKLEVWKQKNNKNVLLVLIYFNTNKIGSSIEMWMYDYDDNDIQEVLDLDGQEANYEMTYIHDDLYKIHFTDLDYSTTIEMDAQFMKLIDNGYIRLKGSTWFSNHIDYGFFDYDKDGIDELVTRRNIYYGAVDWLPNIYTFYKYNDKIKVKVYDMHFDYKKVWQY